MRTLRRTLAILKIVVAQLDVLETMTPTQFTRFRDHSAPRAACSPPSSASWKRCWGAGTG